MITNYFFKNYIFKFLISFLICTFFNNFVYLADVDVKFEFEDLQNLLDAKTGQNIPTAYVGENFRIKVIVSGQDRNNGDVEIVGLDQFNVVGTSQSTNVTVYNSEFFAQKNYIYDLVCTKEGVFTIGPAQVKQNNKTFNSEPESLILQVKKRKGETVARGTTQNGSQEQDYEVFCKLSIDAKTVFVGQPIILSVKVYNRGNILQLGMENIKFSGFIDKEIQQVAKYKEEFEGKVYNVIEKKFLLLPQETGKREIDSVVINFHVPIKRREKRGGFFDDDFFSGLPVIFGENYQQKKVLSNNLQINVLPLPKYSGSVDGVGDFKQFKIWTDKNEAFINEPILFNLQVEGKGNLDQIVVPKLNLPNCFRSYESKANLEQDLTNDFWGGKKTFEYVLQISQQGQHQIPSQVFTYFDTKSKSYKTLKTDLIELNIKDSPQNKEHAGNLFNNSSENKQQEQESLSKNNIKKQQDIHYIEENISEFSDVQKSFLGKILKHLAHARLSNIIFLLLLFLPILFKKNLKRAKNIANKIILNKFQKKQNLNKLQKNLEEIIEKKQITKLYQFFLNYLSVKFNIQENNINQDLINEKLLNFGWTQDKIDNFLSYLNECAGLAFASKLKIGQTAIELEKLFNGSRYWFFYLESKDN
ncbi:MAG: BatD family protein [Candidatus Babeliales bacterium]